MSGDYYKRRAKGLCGGCGLVEMPAGRAYCADCRAKMRAYYYGNHEKNKKQQREYPTRRYQFTRDELRERRKRLKAEVLGHYGGACACCGEMRLPFLTLDHINHDGKAHRLEVMGDANHGGWKFYNRLRELGYPEGLRVLCYNCNCGREHCGGVCPHEIERGSAASRYGYRKRANFREQGLCILCGKNKPEEGWQKCQPCRDKQAEQQKVRRSRQKMTEPNNSSDDIENLGLHLPTECALRDAGVTTIMQARQLTDEQLYDIRRIGRSRAKNLRDRLAAHGYIPSK